MTIVIPEMVIILIWRIIQLVILGVCLFGITSTCTAASFSTVSTKKMVLLAWIIASLGWAKIFFTM